MQAIGKDELLKRVMHATTVVQQDLGFDMMDVLSHNTSLLTVS